MELKNVSKGIYSKSKVINEILIFLVMFFFFFPLYFSVNNSERVSELEKKFSYLSFSAYHNSNFFFFCKH